MRQAGVIAAPALVALDTMVDRLAQDHAHARLLGEALGRCRGVRVAPGQSNIVIAQIEGRRASDVAAALRARGVLVLALDLTTLRLITHNDVSRAECERAAAELQSVLGVA